MRRIELLLILCALATTPGCKSVINKPKAIGGSSMAIAVDARQRFLVSKQGMDPDDPSFQLQKICLEPSPDVFSVLSSALEGSAKYMDKASLNFSATFAESAATIGLRTETIQLLRDSMYRICELALNGDLDKGTASRLHDSYQRSMVTLAAVAALTDAARPVQIALTSRATITRGALMAELKKQLDEEKKSRAEKQAALDTATGQVNESLPAVCEVKVDTSACSSDPTLCREGAKGEKLCDATIGGDKASQPDKKRARSEAFCSAGSRVGAGPCSDLTGALTDESSAKSGVEEANNKVKAAVTPICEETVDESTCAPGAADCKASSTGKQLCEATIQGEAAGTKKQARAEQYCLEASRKPSGKCTALTSAVSGAASASDGLSTAEAAVASALLAVCEVTVDTSPCGSDPVACVEKTDGTALCEAAIKGGPATDADARRSRVSSFCSAEGRRGTDPCKDFLPLSQAVKDAGESVVNSQKVIDQLEADLDEVQRNSDLSAASQVVQLSPSTARPDRASIERIAQTVDRLVTQVYADKHVESCIRLLDEFTNSHEETTKAEAETVAQLKAVNVEAENTGILVRNFELPRVLTSIERSSADDSKKTSAAKAAKQLDAELARLDALKSLMKMCENVGRSLGPMHGGPAS
jgi:hypothetical protein